MLYEYRDQIHTEVEVRGDEDAKIVAPFACFTKPVTIRDSTITQLDLYAVYFPGGLEFTNCKVRCDVLWQSGGHNQAPIRIIDVEFTGFVDLEDCWFRHELVLRRVVFGQGTNLRGNIGTPVEVSFDSPPLLDAVTGQLDLDTFAKLGR